MPKSGRLSPRIPPEGDTRFVERLEEAFTPLLDNPLMGPVRDELSPGLRAHFFRDYVIYYVPTDREIIIVRVVHGRRDRAALQSHHVS